jgi:hypothetical protein
VDHADDRTGRRGQTEARVAAGTRQAIAKKIATLMPKVEEVAEAPVVLHLAEAYVHLASEPREPGPFSRYPERELPSRTKTTTGGRH